MVDERVKDEDQRIEEGYTEFGGTSRRYGSWFTPFGKLGRFFSKFFANSAKPAVAAEYSPDKYYHNMEGPPAPPPPADAGDAIKNPDVLTPHTAFTRGQGWDIIVELELNRKQRYKEFEVMDEYPEVGASFDIYADDCTQKDLKNQHWEIETENELAKDEVLRLFKKLKLDKSIWDIVRNTTKYGDCFTELVVNLNKPSQGIHRIKILDPNFIFRVENEYGYLTGFLQQIPKKSDWDSYGSQGRAMEKAEYIELDKNQIVHWRLHTSDPVFYPYGKSIAALARQTFRSLKFMEDAMLIYRLSRAPERRIFYIHTGNMPASKAESYIERIKAKFKKEKYYSRNRQNIDGRYNPMSVDEDFFVPISNSKDGTKIETLPGAQNLGEVDDVKYFRDKLLACLKIPKDYIVEFDKSPERKANLSQLDAKFARVILRIQRSIEAGLEAIAQRHLALKGYPNNVIKDLRIHLAEPSDMYIKRRLDVDEQKARVVQAVQGLGLFPKDYIYDQYYNMTDDEIAKLQKELKEEAKEAQEMGMQVPGNSGMPMGGGMPMEPGMGGEEEMVEGDPNGIESEENAPPTSNEDILASLRGKLLLENKVELAEKLDNLIIKRSLSKIEGQ